jgi:hypothetical protein
MTIPPNPHPEQVEITQEDREAAADLIETYWSGADASMLKLAQSYRAGHSQGVFARAFARHRLASLAKRSDYSEQAVMVCPQCQGEGRYADGLDEPACSTDCTRCGTNGWIVDLASLANRPADDVLHGCAITGTSGVEGQCKRAACNYPFCEASERTAAVPDKRWTIEGVMAEMLAVAVASIEAEEGDPILEDWPLDCRADVDRWQSVISRALAPNPHPEQVEVLNPAEYLTFADAMLERLFYPSGATRDDAKPYQIARQLALSVKILAASLANRPADDGGWIVGNNVGQWRTFDSFGWAWTDRRDLAVRYARRHDAEMVHGEDEDAWRVEPFVPPQPEGVKRP